MNDLKLDENGDVIIESNDIPYVSGNELTRQKVKQILGTTKGEWFGNADEGINTRAIISKSPIEDEVMDNMLDGLRQVDETFQITEHTYYISGRKLNLSFTAETDSGEEIEITM